MFRPRTDVAIISIFTSLTNYIKRGPSVGDTCFKRPPLSALGSVGLTLGSGRSSLHCWPRCRSRAAPIPRYSREVGDELLMSKPLIAKLPGSSSEEAKNSSGIPKKVRKGSRRMEQTTLRFVCWSGRGLASEHRR